MDATQHEPWVILTTRYGSDARNPTNEQLATAVDELYDENNAQMTEADYAEHPNAWLRYCYDDGPMYVLDIYRNGLVRFEQWADQDYENELAPESSKSDVAREDALRLWMWLVQGDIERIASSGFTSG